VQHRNCGWTGDGQHRVLRVDQLVARHTALTAATSAVGSPAPLREVTVVFDAGQNSEANFDHLREAGLGYVGSVPPRTCPTYWHCPLGGGGSWTPTGSPP
jgi:hypothetical protein